MKMILIRVWTLPAGTIAAVAVAAAGVDRETQLKERHTVDGARKSTGMD